MKLVLISYVVFVQSSIILATLSVTDASVDEYFEEIKQALVPAIKKLPNHLDYIRRYVVQSVDRLNSRTVYSDFRNNEKIYYERQHNDEEEDLIVLGPEDNLPFRYRKRVFVVLKRNTTIYRNYHPIIVYVRDVSERDAEEDFVATQDGWKSFEFEEWTNHFAHGGRHLSSLALYCASSFLANCEFNISSIPQEMKPDIPIPQFIPYKLNKDEINNVKFLSDDSNYISTYDLYADIDVTQESEQAGRTYSGAGKDGGLLGGLLATVSNVFCGIVSIIARRCEAKEVGDVYVDGTFTSDTPDVQYVNDYSQVQAADQQHALSPDHAGYPGQDWNPGQRGHNGKRETGGYPANAPLGQMDYPEQRTANRIKTRKAPPGPANILEQDKQGANAANDTFNIENSKEPVGPNVKDGRRIDFSINISSGGGDDSKISFSDPGELSDMMDYKGEEEENNYDENPAITIDISNRFDPEDKPAKNNEYEDFDMFFDAVSASFISRRRKRTADGAVKHDGVDHTKLLGWKTQYRKIVPEVTLNLENLFYGLGNCRRIEHPKALNECVSNDDIMEYYSILLRSQCLAVKREMMEIVMDMGIISVEKQRFKLNLSSDLVKEKILFGRHLVLLTYAFDMSIFSQLYMDKMEGKMDGSPLSEKKASSSMLLLTEYCLRFVAKSRSTLPFHYVHLTRYLMETIKVVISKLLQDQYVLTSCGKCEEDLEMNRKDQIQAMAIHTFILYGLGPVEKNPDRVAEIFHRFYNKNLDAIKLRVKLYSAQSLSNISN